MRQLCISFTLLYNCTVHVMLYDIFKDPHSRWMQSWYGYLLTFKNSANIRFSYTTLSFVFNILPAKPSWSWLTKIWCKCLSWWALNQETHATEGTEQSPLFTSIHFISSTTPFTSSAPLLYSQHDSEPRSMLSS